MCRRDAPEVRDQPANRGSVAQLDIGCLHSSTDLLAKWDPSRSVLFDLRTKQKFEQFHAEAAMSASETELVAKPYWRDKDVVLMGSGVDDVELSFVCTRLKREGYRNVAVLQGGALGLVRDGGKLLGTPERLSSLAKLSATDLWTLTRQPATLVLADAGRSEFLKELRGARAFPVLNEPSLKRALASSGANDRSAHSPLVAVALLLSRNVDEETLLALSKAAAPTPLLVYSDTYADYMREIAKQSAMWKAHERGPKKTPCLG